jgi:two-component system NtrC family sensor kinase
LTSLINKRLSLHAHLKKGQRENNALKSQLCRLQPLANIGSASSMIAHEINNILTPLGIYASLALKNLDDKALVEKALEKAMLNCQRASNVMESMLSLANGRQQSKQQVHLRDLIDEVFTCLCRDFAKDRINITRDIPADLMLWAVPVQVQQVLMNLILNAREAMLPQGGSLTIRARQSTHGTDIEIRDTGHGIKPTDLQNIFEAFYSTKDSSDIREECFGTGLGLAFCRLVIDSHDGHMSVKSRVSQGTTFSITLPHMPTTNLDK